MSEVAVSLRCRTRCVHKAKPAMKRTYFCPTCQATLKAKVKPILPMARGRRRRLILLSPRPGDYSVVLPEEAALRRGDEMEFFYSQSTASTRPTSSRRSKSAATARMPWSMVARIPSAPAERENNELCSVRTRPEPSSPPRPGMHCQPSRPRSRPVCLSFSRRPRVSP